MFDWLPHHVVDGPPPSSIEEELSRIRFEVKGSRRLSAQQLVAELTTALGRGARAEVAEVSWTNEGRDLAWFVHRNRLSETSFYARVLAALDDFSDVPHVETAALSGGVFGIASEIAEILLQESRYIQGRAAIKGYGDHADWITRKWWKDLTEGRPEEFVARFSEDCWSDWFAEDARNRGTWIATDLREHRVHVVRLSAPWDD